MRRTDANNFGQYLGFHSVNSGCPLFFIQSKKLERRNTGQWLYKKKKKSDIGISLSFEILIKIEGKPSKIN